MSAENVWHEDVVLPALLRHARSTYGAGMRRALESAGFGDIPANGLYVIGGLAMGAGDVPLSKLITDLRVSKQAAGQLVDALVTSGYLKRSVDPEDRRRLNVTLTKRGRSAAAIQAAARQRIDAALAKRMGAEAVETTRRTLAALIEIGRAAEAADKQS